MVASRRVATGLALLSTIATTHTRHELAASVAGQQALTDGFAVAFGVGSALCIAGALVAGALLRARPVAPPAAAVAARA